MAEVPDPWETWTNDELYAAQLSLHLACGRAKSVLRDKHRGSLCQLLQIAQAEATKRNTQSPTPPYVA